MSRRYWDHLDPSFRQLGLVFLVLAGIALLPLVDKFADQHHQNVPARLEQANALVKPATTDVVEVATAKTETKSSPKSPDASAQEGRPGIGTVPDWLIGMFTLVLTVVAVMQLRLEARTASETKDALAVARTNAEAALASARVAERMLNGVERPLLHIEYPHYSPPEAVMIGGGKSTLTVQVFNYGRTPAIIREHNVDAEVSKRVPIFNPAEEFTDLTATGGVVSPGKSIPWEVTFDREALNDVRIGNPFYIFGWVSYEDIIGNSYEHGFCLEWYDGFYMRALDKRANYHRMTPKN